MHDYLDLLADRIVGIDQLGWGYRWGTGQVCIKRGVAVDYFSGE